MSMLFLLLCFCSLAATQRGAERVVTVGGLFPLDRAGAQHREAVRIAIEAIATAATRDYFELTLVRNSVRFKLEAANTQSSERETLDESLSLIRERGASVVLGPETSQNAEIASLVAGLNIVPIVSYGATADTLSNKDDHPLFFRTVPSDVSQARALASTITELGLDRCVLIHTESAYGFGLASAFREAAGDEISISAQVSVPEGADVGTPVIASTLEGLKRNFAADPRLGVIVMLVPTPNDAAAVLHAAVQPDVSLAGSDAPPYIWLGSNGAAELTREYSPIIGDGNAIRGLIASTPARAFNSEVYTDVLTPAWERLISAGREFSQFNVSSPLPEPGTESVFAAYAFDAMLAVAHAVEEILDNDSEADVTGEAISQALRLVSFEGATGLVQFDAKQDRPPLYDIVNVAIDPDRPSGEDLWVPIATYQTSLQRNARPIRFAGGLTEQPQFTPEPTAPPEPEPLAAGYIVLIVLAVAIALALCIGAIAVLLVRRSKARAAERERLLNQPPLRWTAEEAAEEVADQPELASGIVSTMSGDDVDIAYGEDQRGELPMFGLDKLARMPILTQLTESMYITNRSASSLQYNIYLPHDTHAFEIDARPGVGVLKPRQTKLIKLTCKLNHTHKLDQRMKIEVPGSGCQYVPLKFEGEVSLRLDPDELELFGKPIGGGAFGSVYRGRYRGTVVAAKLLRRQHQSDEGQQEAFEQEIKLFEKLRNPYIVNFIGASHVPGKLCMCTELLERGSVLEMMAKVHMTMPLKVKMLLDGARAVSFLHGNGVLYRDLKPDNLLVFSVSLNAVVNCKLSDFGSARIVDDPSQLGDYTQSVGTPIYMAPEIMDAQPYNNKVDIYSFGMMAWEVMAEKQPFYNVKRIWDLPRIVLDGMRPSIDDEWDPGMCEVISSCWLHRAESRPAMADVVEELEVVFDDAKAAHAATKQNRRVQMASPDVSDASTSKSSGKSSSKSVSMSATTDTGGSDATPPPPKKKKKKKKPLAKSSI